MHNGSDGVLGAICQRVLSRSTSGDRGPWAVSGDACLIFQSEYRYHEYGSLPPMRRLGQETPSLKKHVNLVLFIKSCIK